MTKYQLNASFLSSVEASLCARNMRQAFWDYLPFLLEQREHNGMYSIREAIDDILERNFENYEAAIA